MSMSRRQRAELAALSGKRRWCEADGRVAVAALAASGRAVTQFAAECGLDPWRLYHWRSRLAEGPTSPAPVPAFIPVRVAGAEVPADSLPRPVPVASMLELEVAGGRRLRVPEGFSPDAVARLVRALEGGAPC